MCEPVISDPHEGSQRNDDFEYFKECLHCLFVHPSLQVKSMSLR